METTWFRHGEFTFLQITDDQQLRLNASLQPTLPFPVQWVRLRCNGRSDLGHRTNSLRSAMHADLPRIAPHLVLPEGKLFTWARLRSFTYSIMIHFLVQKRLASAIILHSVPLATNPNGALLLTWLMDANELPGRYNLLANRLASFVQHLATHKLASLTILRRTFDPAKPSEL
jgi:hypothetical protein